MVEKNHRDRYIYIDRVLFSVLEALHNQNGHSKYVFGYYNETKREYCRYADITKPFHKARKPAELKHVHFHDLRHTFATRLWEATQDLVKIMKVLGHSNIETTMRYINKRHIDTDSAIEEYEKTFYPRGTSDILSQNSIHGEENLMSYRVS